MSYKRTHGTYAGHDAELNVEAGKVKLVLEMSEHPGMRLAIAAIKNGGKISVQLAYSGAMIDAEIVEGRINTVDPGGIKLSGPNVVSFSKLKL